MASPHVAGAGALLTQAHPTLSAAELKSELMLTANPNVVKEDGKTPADVFDRGSGEIDPNKAADSGLVLDTTTDDYLSYLECVDPDDRHRRHPEDAPERPQPGVDLVQQVRRQGHDDALLHERRLGRDALDGVLRRARRRSGRRSARAVLHDQAGPDAAVTVQFSRSARR